MFRLAALGALLAAACSFSVAPEGGGGDDIADGERITITLDTAADFADPAALTDGVVAARGAIEPDAFVLGGLHARAFADNLLKDDDLFEDALAKTAAATAYGEGYQQVPASTWTSTPANRPRGLGIPSTGNYTILYDGEILLPQGSVTLETDADDRAIVQVALDGTTFGERLFVKQGVAAITLDVPVAGWYPIRAAYAQAGGAARFSLTTTPLFGSPLAIDGDRLRARVTNAPGLIAFGFGGRAMLVAAGESAVPTVDANYGYAAPPYDLDLLPDDFAVRFAGQVRIDEPGTYTFSADIGPDLEDLHRLWIDGKLVAHHWPPMADVPSVAIDLAPGWHDLLVDYADFNGPAQVTLRMSGPGIVDGPIEAARLRPAVAFGLTSAFMALARYPLVDYTTGPGITKIEMPLTAPAGAVIDAIDFGFGIEYQRMSDLTIDLLDCHGSRPLQLDAAPGYHYFAHDLACAGRPVMPATPWGFRVVDNVAGNDPVYGGLPPALWNPVLVATYHGGDRRPFAPAVTYLSRPLATPGAIDYAHVGLAAELRGATLTFEARTAADEASLADAVWFTVADGEILRAPAGEVVQFRLSIIGDGWQLASVDKVEITYVVPYE